MGYQMRIAGVCLIYLDEEFKSENLSSKISNFETQVAELMFSLESFH